MDDYSYLGSGKLVIREFGAAAPFEEVGNVSALSFSPQTNTITLADSTKPGGGTRNRVDRVTEVQMAYTFHDFAPANFARALRGTVTTIAAGNVIAEPVVAYPGGFIPLARRASAITSVKNAAGTTTYDADVDYELRDGGLFIPLDGDIAAPVNGAANLTVAYAHGAVKRVEALTTSQKQYEVLFLGLNEARSGKEVRVHAHKVSGGVMAQLGLIGEEYGSGEVTGALLADTTKGAGLSQYFTVDIQE
ncbi:hypothetical protein [Xanthomonas campestris]|uniref:phage tail tube protein n=1 Tax=Xanthomonas campestris TaxID=339 RepID=UPI001F31DD1E|nr:hypothetical protein [Xanthomonas campestris]MCF8799255.1 hypothetical protein [Xanthomonas campestris pv. campestris]MCF8813785.1 hypothetical protein [Xanthomonas campestris pv. campestris]WHO87398.1 hypothetical protein QMY63_14940 [Xanthomonas campestris]